MADRRKTVRRLIVAGLAALALIAGVVAIPTLGSSVAIGRQGNLPGVYDASKQVSSPEAPRVDPETLPHDHDDPSTKNDVSRGGAVGEDVQDPTNAAERTIAAAYVAQARRTPDPPLATVRPLQKRLLFPQDRYAMANGCYRMAGKPTYFKPTDLGTYLLYTKRRKFRTVDGLANEAGADTVDGAAQPTSGKKRPVHLHPRRHDDDDQGQDQLPAASHQGLHAVPRGGRRHRRTPALRRDVVPGGARLRRRAHPRDGLRVPRAAARTAASPGTAFGVDVRARGLPRPHGVPAGYGVILETVLSGEPQPRPGRLADLQGLAGADSLTHERHLLPVAGARVARRAADLRQPARREQPAVHDLSAQEELLQRHGLGPAAGQAHVRAAGLHRRPVRWPRQGLLPDRQVPVRGPRGHQRAARWPSSWASRPRCPSAAR